MSARHRMIMSLVSTEATAQTPRTMHHVSSDTPHHHVSTDTHHVSTDTLHSCPTVRNSSDINIRFIFHLGKGHPHQCIQGAPAQFAACRFLFFHIFFLPLTAGVFFRPISSLGFDGSKSNPQKAPQALSSHVQREKVEAASC
jgi:hypothetical protein